MYPETIRSSLLPPTARPYLHEFREFCKVNHSTLLMDDESDSAFSSINISSSSTLYLDSYQSALVFRKIGKLAGSC
jgi:hypothetical protein